MCISSMRHVKAIKYLNEIKKFDEMDKKALENEKCTLCLEEAPDTCIYPCNHGGVCFECAKKLDICYLCRDVSSF